MSEPLLQAVDLQCERDERILFRDLSFSILPGTVTRVEGPNGSGKTTLLRMLAGLNDAWSGNLLWCGKPRSGQSEEFLRNTLYLGHRPGIKPLLTPLENLRALTAGRRPLPDPVLREALDGTGLTGFQDVPCRNLSAGQQRRVALARLLIADDVWTTGGSMRAARGEREAIGVVAFSRGPLDRWVTSVFALTQE